MLRKTMMMLLGVAMLLLLSVSCFAATGSQPDIVLNGAKLEAAAYVDGEKLYLPLRAVSEALDYQVQWSEQDRTIQISKPGKNILLDLLNFSHRINAGDHEYYLSLDYTIIADRTYVSTDFVYDNLGLAVSWDRPDNVVQLTSIKENDITIKTVKDVAENGIVKITSQYPQLEGLADQAVQDKINASFAGLSAAAKNEILHDAAEMQKEIEMNPDFPGSPHKWENFFDYRVKYNQNNLLSVVFLDYRYTGGAHGSTLQSSYTYDLNTGVAYQLKDLFESDADYMSLINTAVKQEIDARVKEGILPEHTLAPFESIREDHDFYLSDNAVVIYFQQYEHWAYAAGIQEFPVGFDLLGEILQPEIR